MRMQFPQILQSLREPWLVMPSTLDAIATALDTRLENGRIFAGPSIPTEDDEDDDDTPKEPGCAIIPVFGILGKHLGMMEMMCGGCSVDAISQAHEQAIADPAINRIAFYFNSPGGQAVGIPELASQIKQSTKPTLAYTDSLCASAALWLASSCEKFYSTASAQIGSIGCYSLVIDESRALENDGIKVNAFQSGKYKLLGASFRPMSDEEKSIMQARVDKIGAQFRTAIKSKRKTPDDMMQGQMFDGDEAAGTLTDGTVFNLKEAIAATEAVTPKQA